MVEMGINREDVPALEHYSKIRDSKNRAIIEIKKKRRISTKTFSFLFENREIVLNQIEEMIFIEGIRDEEEIRRIIDVYSELLPGRYRFSVSMFIEFEDEKTMLQSMKKMVGIENQVFLVYDSHEIHAVPEEGRSTNNLESTLQYLKFIFSEKEADEFKSSKNVFIEVRHREYGESARIPDELLSDLKNELFNP